MGKLRKIGKKIWKGIKKVGKKVGKVFKKVLKPFAKVFNKLGPIGTMAMSMFLPGIGQLIAGWGANLGGVVGNAISFVGNAVNYVATAPKKIFNSITGAIGKGFEVLNLKAPVEGSKSWFDNFQDDFGTFDVSAEGQARIANIKAKDSFFDTEKSSLLGKEYEVPTETTPPKDSEGFVADAREKLKDVKDVKVPGVGTVGDVAWATSTGVNAFNAYSSMTAEDIEGYYNSNTSDAELMLSQTNQGAAFDMKSPVWNFDPNQSPQNNLAASRESWNNFYGLDSTVDPLQMGGYGYNYETWMQQNLGRV